jgi:hypothetical protein
MTDRLDALYRSPDCVGIADIGGEKLYLVGKIVWPLSALMDLPIEAVDNPDPVPALEKFIREMRADESGAASNENARLTRVHV